MAANQVSAQARGVVVQLQGQAWAVDANGNKRVLRVGDAVQEGEQLITAAGTQLELGLPNGQNVAVAAERTLLIDANLLGTAPVDASEAAIADLNAGAEQVIAALNEGRDLSLELDPTAAGLAGGEGGDAHGFVRLLRISEDTSPLELTSSARAADADTIEFTQGTAAAAATEIEPNGPQANNDQATVDEDGTVSINVLGNDNGDGLRVQGQPTAGNGTVSVNADGTLSYVPNSNFNGSDTISYTVVDANGNTSTATVSVTVNPVNDVPTINGGNNQNVSTLEDTPLSGSVAGSDVDGDPLNYGKGSDPSHGSVAVNPDGSWTYTPNSNYNGPDSFTIVVSDGKGGTDTVTINVGVTPVDDLPVISSGAGSVVEDSQPSTSGTLSASDVDNPDLRFVAANPAGQYGSLSIGSDGKWTYTLDARAEQLAANEARVETFTVTLNDGSTSTIVINVTGTNDGAVIGAGAGDKNSGSVTEDVTLTSSGKLTVTDTDAGQAELKPATVTNAYGSFTVDKDGNWTFTLNNSAAAVQGLAGETVNQQFTVESLDGTTSTVTITINGTNDGAVIGAGAGDKNTGSVTEDTTLTSSGKLTVTDVDNGQAELKPATVTNAYGSFTVDKDGNWTFTLNNSANAVQSLKAGETVNQQFTVESLDGTTSTVTITINGTNDGAVIGAGAGDKNTGAVTEDTTLTSSGKLTVTDTDTGQAELKPATVTNAYGSFTVDKDGNWTFTLNNSAAAVQSLAGETVNQQFTVESLDGTTSTVTITINGTNDGAVIGAGAGDVTEDATTPNLTDSGTLTIADADAGQASFQAGTATPVGSTLGSLSITAAGTWTYTVANSAVQYLKAGETKLESFTVKAADGTTHTVTVTIHGTNDGAVIGAGAGDKNSGSVTEDVTLTSSGKLTVTDTDAGQAELKPATVTNAYGSFTVDKDGNWTFTLNNSANAVQSLKAGETVNQTFQVESLDGTTSTVTITINGTNDGAVIGAGAGDKNSGSVTEDVTLTSSGKLTVTDTDAGQAELKPATVTNAYGSFTVDKDGNWTFTLDNSAAAVQGLAAGQTVPLQFQVESLDGTTSTVSITVTGTGETATIGAGRVQEDTTLSDSGTLSATGGASFVAETLTGSYGSLSMASNGQWTYTLANGQAAVQALSSNDTKTETFTVKLSDGSTTTVSIDVRGLDDAAVINGDATGAVTEDATTPNLTDSGTLTIADADAGQSSFQAGTATPVGSTLGSLSITAAGTWTYTVANSAVQYLKAGETKLESFTVKAADGTTHTVTVTIHGTNDGAVIGAGAGDKNSGSVTEDTTLTSSGKLTVTDVDNGQAELKPATVTNAYGSFTVDKDGNWTFTLNNSANAVQSLKAGESVNQQFTVESLDGTTSTVTITINGTNDGAVIGAGAGDKNTGSVTEDTTLTSSGKLTVTDTDAGQAELKPATVTNAYGSFTVDKDGNWTFTLNNSATAVQSLKAGETVNQQFTVESLDGTTSTVTITINGTNDGAVIGAGAGDKNTGSVTEDTTLTSSGKLTVTDVDNGQAELKPATVTNAYGSFTVDKDGNWTFTLDNSAAAVQGLAAGQTVPLQFQVESLDGTTSTVSITVTGTGETATIGAGRVQEDTTLSDSGTLSATGGASFVAETLTGSYGSLSMASNGQWTYTLANGQAAVQALSSNDTRTETFTVKLSDGSTTTVSIDVRGLDDAAVINGDATGAVTEDATTPNLTDSGTLTIADADAGQASFQAGSATLVGTTLGSLSITAAGTWTYTVANSAVQYLKAGETKLESFTVKAADGTTHTVTVTIHGTNDGAVIGAGAGDKNSGSVTEDTTLTSSGKLTVTDVDNGQAELKPATVTNAYGSFTVDKDGNWTFTLDNSAAAVQGLAAGQTVPLQFQVESLDGTTSTVSITVTGTGETATIGAGRVQEDTTLSDSGTLSATGGASFVAETLTGSYGSLSMASNGQWTHTLANGQAAVQALSSNDTRTETFTVKLSDGSTTTVSIDVRGLDDAAVINGDATGAVTEDATTPNLTDSGTLTIADADAGQSSFQAGTATPVGSTLGSLSITAAGTWTYTVANSAVQYLKAGETKLESFTVKAADGTTHTVTVTIHGTNDGAVIGAGAGDKNSGSVTEDVTLTSSGKLTVTDVDNGQAELKPATVTNAYGSFTVDKDGNWTFTLDNSAAAVQGLAAGQTVPLQFQVESLDGTTSTVSITVTGTGETATIGAGRVQEDTTLSDSGTLSATGGASFVAETLTGSYGSLSMASNGQWTYTLANGQAAVQALSSNDTRTETFTVKLSDGSTTTVSIDVRGLDDAAVINGDATGAVTEDATTPNLTDSGTLTIADADAGQSSFQAGTATPVGSTLGSLSITAAGTWTYTVANSAVQYLKAGETKLESFTVKAADGTTHTVTVTIHGTNDGAVIGAGAGDKNSGSVTEDVTLTSSGKLTVTDVDNGQAELKPATVTNAYGSFTVDKDGNWTFTLNNSANAVQSLKAGESVNQQFTVESLDGTTSTVTITINGTNDGAVIGAGAGDKNTGSVTEDTTLTSSGKLTVTDTDAGQAELKPATVTNAYGSFTVDKDGNWTFTLNNSATAVQSLKAGETVNQQFTVESLDGTTSTVTITINGTNDGAVIGAGAGDKNTGSVTEDTTLTSSGKLTVTDVDNGQAELKPATVTNAYGSFTVDKDGNWTFTLNNSANAVQSLKAGETVNQTFQVESLDGTTSTVTITINGTNDGAVIGAGAGDKNTGSVTEDTTLTSSGKLTVTDVDNGQAELKPATVTNAYGSFTVDKDGNWTFTLNNSANAVQSLKAGETVNQTFQVESLDGTTSTVTITINGTNDGAVISGDATGAVTEDATTPNLTDSGTLTIADADAGQASFQAGSATLVGTTLGSLSITAAGTWTYTVANSAVQYLKAGETKLESFTVKAADGTTHTVTVTIHGTNDGAVIGAGAGDKNSGSVTEDVTLTSSGKLTVTDVDNGQAELKPATVTNAYGSFSVDKDGNWTFTLNNSANAVQSLKAGETVNQTFQVESLDGTTSTVTITINGTNDGAVIGAGAGDKNSGSVTEDTTLTSSGKLTVTDTDAGQAELKPATVTNAYGSFTVDKDGNWTFTLNNSANAVQSLKAGETVNQQFTVESLDGTTSTVTITINGTNDGAVIGAGAGDKNSGSVTEDTTLTSSGKLTVTDTDAGQAELKPATVTNAYGSFTVDKDGNWTFTLNNSANAVQSLKAGESVNQQFTVESLDGTTSTVTITINGTNDGAVIGGDATGAVTEDATTPNLTDSGTLTITDADAGQASFQAGTATPVGSVLGSLSITAAGTWTYTVANSAVQYLKAGETKLESFTVKAADGTTHTVNVTITGTNDVPVISGDAIGAVTEDASTPNLTDSGTLTIADADAGQASFQAGTATPVGSTLGSLSITAAGTWTYTVANSAVQYLKAGETKLESFTVKAADGTTHTVNVTITGTNDVPVISGDAIGAVTEDASSPNLTDSGTLTIADADAGQANFQAGTATPVGSVLGSLSITAAGTWTYTVANSAVQYLKARETKVESFTVLSADGTSHTITVTITGTNDVATISGTATGNVLEAGGVANALAGSATASGTLTVSDADSGQSSFLAPASLNGTYGSFTFNASTGAWTYALDNSKAATQALKGGQLVHDTLTVSSSDGTASQVIDVTITGANDHASISGTATGTVTEDGNLNASGTLSVADVDSGEAVFQTPASLTGSYGSFTFNTSTGAWTYAANNGALQSLAAGQSVTDTLVVKSADGTATQNVVVTLNGANDAPTGANNTFTIQEDGSKSFAAADFGFSDVDSGDSLKAVRIDSLPTAGSLTLGGVAVTAGQLISAAQLGSLVFTPAANANGSNYANFTFSVQDQANAFDAAPNTISISVSAVNDAPTAAGGLVSGTEDTALVFNWTNFNVADVDSSAASLGIKISSLPADGLLQYSTNGTSWQTVAAGQTLSKATIDAGWLRFVPDANESGSDALGGNGVGNQQADYARFNYVATDGSLESATATVRVDIAPVVDKPTLSLVNASSSQLISTSWETVGNSDNSSEQVSGTTLEGWTLVTTGDTLAGGTNVFEVWRAGDSQQAQSGSNNTVVLGSGNGQNTLELNNASNNAQTLGIERAVSTVAGAVYDLSLDYAGRPGFTENFTRIAIYVDGVKIASYANTSPQTSFNWQNLHFSFVGTGGSQTIKIVTDATEFNAAGRGAMIDDIVLTQYQGVVSGNSASGTQTAVALKNYVGAALTDTDGSESLSLSFSGLPAGSIITTSSNPAGYVLSGGAITISGSELASAQLIMPSSYNGALAIGVTATSTELGQTASTSGTLNLQVLPGSTPPVAVNDTASTNEDTAVTINVLANDSDRNGDTLTVQTATAANGTVVINANGTITYTPNANFNGSDTISYSIGDGKGGNASATVAVTVAAVNDAPVIAAGAAVTGSEDSPYVFNWADFKASDVDNTLTIQIRSLPSDGKLEYYNGSSWVAVSQNQSLTQADISAGKLRFVPDAHESGTDAFGGNGVGNQQADYATFTYRASDGTVNTSNATMRVDVTPLADAPKLYMGGVSSADGSALISTSPGGDGLTVRQYTALGNVSAGNMDTADEVKQLLSLLNAATPASTSVSTAPENYTAGVNGGAPTGIPTDGAYRVSGLIYLEAGKTYTFSSYQDDTALLRIGGTEVLAKEHDSYGNITASDYTPTVSGYYTIDWAVYNGSGVGAYKPYLSVNGATPKELTNGNFKLYSSLSQLDSAGGVYDPLTVGPDASGGYYPLTIRGVEDSEIKLGAVSYALSDTDGSEVLGALLAKNLLVGTVLSDGTNSFTATAGNTSVDIKSWNLSSLKLVPPSNFSGSYNLVLEGRSTESSTGAVATSTTSMAITVANVNDAPVASADAGAVTEDSGSYVVSGNVLGNDSDVDGDTLAVQAVNGSAAAVGSVISTSYGTLRINADGSYTYTLNNDDARINALRSGETLSERINYTAKDPAGLTSNAVLTITIHGNTDQVVLWGSNGNDQIGDAYGETVVAGVDNNAFVLQLTGAALGSNPAANAQGQVVAGSAAGAQIIDAGGGNDYVEAGAGNDVIYAGDSDSSGHTFAEVKAHGLMTLADGAGNLLMSDGSGLLDQSKVSVSNPWADIVNGGSGNDALIGQGGYDLLYGGSGDDYLSGGSGSDGLRGGTGNDRLEGGSGSDVLRGDLGADTFAWSLGDQSATAGAVNATTGNDYGLSTSIRLVSGATDLVTDFSKTEGDKLDLRDLLQGESHVGENPGNLNQYLHFEYSNNSTIVHVSSSGGFAGGVYDASKENQTIVLQNVNLLVDSNGTSLLNTNAIVQDLLKNNRLITD